MKRKLTFLVIAAILFVACKNSTKKPEKSGTDSATKEEDTLADIHKVVVKPANGKKSTNVVKEEEEENEENEKE